MVRAALNLAFITLLAACAGGDLDPQPSDEPDVRPETSNTTVTGPTDDDDDDVDDDDDDDPVTALNNDPDDPDDPDPPIMSEECPANSCTIGVIECQGLAVATCEADPINASCGIWSTEPCGALEACVDGACEVATGCVDDDGDGYGPMCANGADCNDLDPTVYEGATEVCDGVDNNCDGTPDEGYQIGMACTYGTGACQADGTIQCDPNTGGTFCTGQPVGTPEICDGADNDCNNIVDDGGVCSICQSDIFEPNDVESDAELVQVNTPRWGFTCPGDTDWFELETQTGTTYHIYVTFPEERSDLLIRGWVDGVNVITGDTTGRDYEEFVVTGDSSKTFQIEVVDRDNIDSFYRVSLVDEWNCFDEDGFVPNQAIQTAALLPQGWITEAFMCDGVGSDWFRMGELTAGDPLYVGINGDGFTDLDLHVWGDPDGDNTYERMLNSATFSSLEEIDTTVPHTGDFFIEVVDFDGFGGAYDIGWTDQ